MTVSTVSSLPRLSDEIRFDVPMPDRSGMRVVGDRAWEAWMTRLSRPIFSNAEIRFFDPAEREKAWKWIEDGLSNEHLEPIPVGSS